MEAQEVPDANPGSAIISPSSSLWIPRQRHIQTQPVPSTCWLASQIIPDPPYQGGSGIHNFKLS